MAVLRSILEPGTTPWVMRRAQWKALGLSDVDFDKPKIAIVNSSSGLASCFSHLDGIVAPLREAITAAGGVAFEIRTADGRGVYLLARDRIDVALRGDRADA